MPERISMHRVRISSAETLREEMCIPFLHYSFPTSANSLSSPCCWFSVSIAWLWLSNGVGGQAVHLTTTLLTLCCARARVRPLQRLVAATLDRLEELEQIKEEVNHVEVQVDCRHDVIIGAEVQHYL